MKQFFRAICSPILSPFEKGQDDYHYKPLNRAILIFIGVVFGGLTALVLNFIPDGVGLSFLIPVVVFGGVSLVTLIVGLLGSDRAVCKIWGNR